MPEFYKNYVQDICNKIEEKARMEFLYIWNEHQRTGLDNCVISDKFHLNLIDFPMTWTVFAISYRPPISLKIRSSGKISWRRSFPAPSNSSSALTNFWKEFHKIIKILRLYKRISSIKHNSRFSSVGEHMTEDHRVPSSILGTGTFLKIFYFLIYKLKIIITF